MRLALVAFALVACGGPEPLYVIPDEPDSGVAEAPDARVPEPTPDASYPDSGYNPECTPSTHTPTPCMSAGCYGAVLCLRDRLVCVAPECNAPPEECDYADYVFIVDRSASMTGHMPFVQAATSSLTRSGRHNYFFIDVPGFSEVNERPRPNVICYEGNQQFPIPRCEHVAEAIDQFDDAYWGGIEFTYDALADLPNTVQWTPGSSKHAFVFADEPGQGEYFLERDVAARLASTGIKVHAYVKEKQDFNEITQATGGSLHGLTGYVTEPCP